MVASRVERKAGRPNRGLVPKNTSLFDHQYAALERVAEKQGRTFPEVLRSALDGLNESMAKVEIPASMQSVVVVSRNHITQRQDEALKRLSKKTKTTMAHLTRVAVMAWLNENKK